MLLRLYGLSHLNLYIRHFLLWQILFFVFVPIALADTEKRKSNDLRFKTILELNGAEDFLVSPAAIIEESTCQVNALRKKKSKDQLVRLLIKRGKAFVALNQIRFAKESFEEATKIQPNNCEARGRYASALLILGQESQGKAVLKALLQDYPDYPPVYSMLAAAAGAAKDYDSCVSFATNCIKLDSDSVPGHYNRAMGYYSLGAFDKCIKDIDFVIANDVLGVSAPLEELYTVKGNAYLSVKQPQKALLSYLAARKANQSFKPALLGLLLVFDSSGKYNACCYISLEIVKLEPNHATAWMGHAEFLAKASRFGEARQAARKAIELSPKNPRPWYLLGQIETFKENYSQALESYEESLKQVPDFKPSVIGKTAILCGCPDSRFRDGKKALRLALILCKETQAKDHRCLALLARSLAECGRYKEAVWFINNAIRITPLRETQLRLDYTRELNLFENNTPYRMRSFDPAKEKQNEQK